MGPAAPLVREGDAPPRAAGHGIHPPSLLSWHGHVRRLAFGGSRRRGRSLETQVQRLQFLEGCAEVRCHGIRLHRRALPVPDAATREPSGSGESDSERSSGMACDRISGWISRRRFDISEIYEFYGSSEGNLAFANMLNLDRTVGVCPLPHAIVKYDVDAGEPIRDENGFLQKVGRGESGLLLGRISSRSPFLRLHRQGSHREEDHTKRLRRG